MRKRTSNSSIDAATIKKQHRTEAVRLVRMTTRQGIEEPCEGKLSSTVLKTSQQGRPAGLVQQDGRIDVGCLRELFVSYLPKPDAEKRLWISIDTSSIARPDAVTSPDRTAQYVHNLPECKKPITSGWQFSTVVALAKPTSSWSYILDQQRVTSQTTPIQVAETQLQRLAPH